MTVPMLMMPPPMARTRFSDWPLAVKSILGFWLFYYLTVVARAFLSDDPATVMFNRSLTLGIGILLTFCVYAAFRLLDANRTLKRAIIVGLASSFVAAATLAGGCGRSATGGGA